MSFWMTPVQTFITIHPYRCLNVYTAHTHRPLCSSRSWPGSHTWRVRLGHRVEPHQPDVDPAGPTCARWLLPQHSLAIPRRTPTGQPGLVHRNAPEGEGKQFECVYIWRICTKKCSLFVILTGTLKLTTLGGTNMPAAEAVRCLVRQTALLALVSARGTIPSVRHCFSLSLKYWHREANTPTSRWTPTGWERGLQAVLTFMK